MTCSTRYAMSRPSYGRHNESEGLTGMQFHRFMDLPLSIRYMIYELLLIRGKIFVRNSIVKATPLAGAHAGRLPGSPFEKARTTQNGAYQYTILPYTRETFTGRARQRYTNMEVYPQPETGMLRGVSKAVQDEAERIFWSAKNVFVFPAGEFLFPRSYHSTSLSLFADPLSTAFMAKAVSYTFDMRDAGPLNPYVARECHWLHNGQDGPTPFDDLSPARKMQTLHDVLERQLEKVWGDRCFLITRHLRLDRLQIDFEDCFCPLGCCRKVEYVCAQLAYCAGLMALCYRRPFRHGFPAVVEVLGFKNQAENEMICERLAGGCRVSKDAFTFVDRVDE